ncbi:MAG: hypothetical protein HW412_416 [Bacteroidetes bacterium]|nr:hypothetical protein [Bacteroidota bacterium]
MRWFLPLLLSVVVSATAQERKALLLGSSKRAVILRWVVDVKKYPDGGFNVFRQSAESADWRRLNSQPIVPIRDRGKARALFGDRYNEMENLLFTPKPKGLNLQDAIQQEENRSSLALLMADIDAQVAEALGMRFDDATAEEGQRYTYRLTRVDRGTETDVASGEGERSDAEIDPPAGFKGTARDSLVELVWAPEQRFSGYNVYRSEKKSGTFAKVNVSTVLVLETEFEGRAVVPDVLYRDQSVLAGRTYWYSVTGINAFAQESERTEQISVEVKPVIVLPTPPRPNVMVRQDSVFLTWGTVKGEGIEGYHIYRANDKPDSMKRVTSRPVRGVRFLDEGLSERTAYFYAIAAVDEVGNESALSPVALADVLDFGAPRPPEGITIETDTGKIMLRWQANTEKDMLGYHVFKATKDTLREHFFQTTKVPIRQPVFVDQVPRGADYTLYYRLVAVDSTYQFSDFSPIIRGKLPDIVFPIAPIWKDLKVKKDRIELAWVANPEQDIVGYDLYRRSRGESQWSKLNDVLLSPATTRFGDTSAAQGSQYEYMLQAIDDAKNASRQSAIVAARRYDTDPPKTPASIDAMYDSTRHIILLSWDRTSDNTLRGVVVFRSVGENGKFVQKSRLLQDAEFTDGDVKKGESYRYRLRAYDRSGNHSEFSQPVIVTTGRASR